MVNGSWPVLREGKGIGENGRRCLRVDDGDFDRGFGFGDVEVGWRLWCYHGFIGGGGGHGRQSAAVSKTMARPEKSKVSFAVDVRARSNVENI